MRNRKIFGRLVLAVFVGHAAAVAAAEEDPSAGSVDVFVTGGPGALWDDESFLGMAVAWGGGVGYRLGAVGLEIAADHRSHHREFASGVVFTASGLRVAARALYYFRGGAAEPYVGGSIGVERLRRTSEFPSGCMPGASGPVCSGVERFDSTYRSRTTAAVVGVRVVRGRWFIRPEFEVGHAAHSFTMTGWVALGRRW